MNKQAKLHTIELTENELAKVLFGMGNTNGRNHGRCITSIALEALGAKDIDSGALHSKAIEMARTAGIPTFLNYYDIQKEWEEFLGIGRTAQVTVDRIAELEKELAEVKGVGMTTHEAKPVCKKCKWWINGSFCDFMYTTPGGEAYKKGHGVGIEVTVLDASGLWVQLKTGPEFGCVNFHTAKKS